MRNDHITSKLLASRVQTLFRVRININLKPIAPASLAKLVPATQLQRHALLVARLLSSIEIGVAHHAVATIIYDLTRIKYCPCLHIHGTFDFWVVEDARLVRQFGLVREPFVGHELAIPPA